LFRRLAMGPEGDPVHGPHLDRPDRLLHDRPREGIVGRSSSYGPFGILERGRKVFIQQQKFCSSDDGIHLRYVQCR